MSDPIRIAVVDDHPMLREGVVRTLADEGDIEVVGEGATAQQAIDFLATLGTLERGVNERVSSLGTRRV